MNRRKERFIETFVMIMFPVALLVACTTNANDDSVSINSNAFNSAEIADADGILKTSALPYGKPPMNLIDPVDEPAGWSILKGYDEQHSLDSPSLQLAVYKPPMDDTTGENSIHAVTYTPAVTLPEKYTFRFASDNYTVPADDMMSLKQHAEFLLRNPNFTLTVSGHTDHLGSNAYNQKLSEQRAQFVADMLIGFGAPQPQLIVDGYGETVPISRSNLEENRRVELQYSQTMLLSAM